jgi:phosphoribosylformylglycinamidine synthase
MTAKSPKRQAAPAPAGRATRARVLVFPRPEVLDPQGKAIRDALARLGFAQVEELRAGKCFDLALEAADAEAAREQLRRMCERLLANPLVERYEIQLLAAEVPE